MNHWETAGRIAAEHRADLDREAVREGLAAALVKGADRPVRRPLHARVISRIRGRTQGIGALVRAARLAGLLVLAAIAGPGLS